MLSKYSQPKLTDHKVLYKGKRYWVFEIDKEHPYENYEKDCNCVVFDKFYGGCVISWCNKLEDGSFKGIVSYGQGSIEVDGRTPKELVDSVVSTYKWMERN